MSTVKNSEMTPTKQKHPPSLLSYLVTKSKSIYKSKSDAIKKAMKAAELRMSQGLPLDDSCSINYLFSEIESQEREKQNSKLDPVKSVDPSANMRPDSTPDNKKKDDSYSFMTISVSTIQHHPNTHGISHHKGYTIIQTAFKEHKNNINFDDEHTSLHQPDKISVETKTKNRPSDSCSRSRTSEKHQPQEHKFKEASLKRPVGCRKSKEKHQEFSGAIKSRPRASVKYKPQKASLERPVESGKETDAYQEFSSAVEPKAHDRYQKPAKSRPRTVNLQPEPLEDVSKESQSKDFQLNDYKPLPNFFLHTCSVLLSGKIFEGDGDSVHTANYLKNLPILPNFDFQVNQECLKREFL
ncbi:hypothetical protein DSO57_1016129 [Entomophthora muscae]|uniref:Uncharacterized protein n=1 Tax=Entomophthora muscae TaxID=34485 RepID=A0ACC2SI99_9FUNG|nr:hypothetical protein DSO57_1016129 [Entomophthora muscae]